MAFNIWPDDGSGNVVDFFRDRNTMPYANMYNFNAMTGGARLNGDGIWKNGYGSLPGCAWWGMLGDIYHLFYTIKLTTKEAVIAIEDEVDTNNAFSYNWFPARWCRILTDAELRGYKLYINSANTDIKKLGLNNPLPSEYSELPKGYLKGVYVLYLLDNPNPKHTNGGHFRNVQKCR